MRCCSDNHYSLVISFLIRKCCPSIECHDFGTTHYLLATQRNNPPSFNCQLIHRLNWFSFPSLEPCEKHLTVLLVFTTATKVSESRSWVHHPPDQPCISCYHMQHFRKQSPILFVMQWPLVFSSLPFSPSTSTDGPLQGASYTACHNRTGSRNPQWNSHSLGLTLPWSMSPSQYEATGVVITHFPDNT